MVRTRDVQGHAGEVDHTGRPAAPGTFMIEDSPTLAGQAVALWMVCPCGCGRVDRLPLRIEANKHPVGAGASWAFDGNRQAPTLDPSIHTLTGAAGSRRADQTHWHGWLRAGIWSSV